MSRQTPVSNPFRSFLPTEAMALVEDGSLQSSDLYQATVRHRARLAYNSLAGWLEGNGLMPPGIGTVDGLDENLRLQDRVAQRSKALRHLHGALNLDTIEARPVFDGEKLKDLEAEGGNRAKDIIEDFMIAAWICSGNTGQAVTISAKSAGGGAGWFCPDFELSGVNWGVNGCSLKP
ncbi:MAG: hypothetical protein A2Y76_10930 [Planctomycetes bacterium RBG_13_60_9]|nr:MAG: hypothetical protein A2Y76_10930 [Planctomycetes bacterium RBG_13_60_9]